VIRSWRFRKKPTMTVELQMSDDGKLSEQICFLFDLGGVLVRLEDPERALAWSGGELDLSQIAALWQGKSDLIVRFETGACEPEEFGAAIINEFNLTCTTEELLREFQQYVIDPYPGARQIVREMRSHGLTACFSNTNCLHWQQMKERMKLFDAFDYLFPSHLIKMRKPEPQAYRLVIEKIGLNPEKIYFFDDTRINIEIAREFGINAYQVEGVAQLREICSRIRMT